MNRPAIIGIVPLYDKQRKSLWMVPGYMEGIVQAGGLPVIFPLTCDREKLEQLLDRVDGVLFTGGQDVDPARYGQQMQDSCGEICRKRDEMEWELLRLCRVRRKPAYGICRGIQLFNAALGGTLYQHIPDELPSEVEHHMTPPYDRAVHPVTVDEDSMLYRILGKSSLRVNSYHHQGVRDLSPVLTACAWAPDGLVEAVEDRKQPFFLATQWHPEFSWEKDASSRRIFQAFVDACRQTARKSLCYSTVCDIL